MPKKMNLLGKIRQKFVIDSLKSTDWSRGSEAPLIVELDTTEACDLACPGCISQDIMATNNRFSNDRLLEMAEEFHEQGVRGVILIGGGEPLAHPAVGDFMQYLGENDIHIGITTNGTFIHRYLDVIARHASWTRVSMDAATAKTFDVLRPSKAGASKFDRIVENMRALAKVKRGKLGFSFLVQTPMDGSGVISNIHEIYDAAVLARDIGCDYFEVKPSYQFRDDVDHALMVHDQQLMQQAREEIERIDDLATGSFSVMKAINLDASLDGRQASQPKSYQSCPVAELRTLVCPSGAYICPYWRGKDDMKIGDMNDASLNDVWHGSQRREVMQYVNPSSVCTFHCLRHETNVELLDLIEAIQRGDEVEVVEEFDRFV